MENQKNIIDQIKSGLWISLKILIALNIIFFMTLPFIFASNSPMTVINYIIVSIQSFMATSMAFVLIILVLLALMSIFYLMINKMEKEVPGVK